MNDLAERALRGLDVARRHVLRLPMPWLAAGGFVASALIVVVGGRIGAAPAALPLNTWLGLLPQAGYRIVGVLPGLLMLAGVAVLGGLWLVTLGLVSRRTVSHRALWGTAACWALPFVIGPPLLSTDVFSSIARGMLAQQGLSPYHHGPGTVDDVQLANAIDPSWRNTPSTGGPLSVAIEHLFATSTASNPLGMLLLLRGLGLVSAVAIGRLATELAGTRRESALVATALNPAVLIYVVSGAHLEGPAIALLLAAMVRAGRRHWTTAIVFACLAAAIRPIALIALVLLVAVHAGGLRRAVAWRVVARDSALAVAVLAGSSYLVPYGFGWLANLHTVTREHTPFAVASLVSDLISVIVSPASFDDLAVGGRIAAVLAAFTVVGYLLVTVRARPLERTVGYGLLAAALLGPVLYPWFLLWGLLCLAPTARGALRDWVIALSLGACVLAPVGFTPRTGEVVTLACFALVLAWLVPRLVLRRSRRLAAQRALDETPTDVSAEASPVGRHGPAPS